MNLNEPISQAIERLNPQQREAVENIKGPVLVIAGAGSGKTSVLTARIALLMERGILPERILALTFTKKAADEMKRRIAALAGSAAARLTMGTFHSVFISFLRPYAHMLGFPENFTILDEDDSLACLKRCIRGVLEATRVPEPMRTKSQKLEYQAVDKQYKAKSIASRISMCKNELITADEYATRDDFALRDSRAKMPLLKDIFIEYRNACWRSGTMDFDDILLYTDMLMNNNPEVCRQIAASFDYIMVDEYQDTNTAQYSILRRLTRNNSNICVVGDDSQSIYAFRGARIENIFSFQKQYPGCRTVRLEHNYRSTKNIVEAANKLIENNENRIPKKCFTDRGEGDPIELVEAPNEKEEAAYIADTILAEKKAGGLRWNDFAVLYRTNSQSRAMEESLIRRRIPYVIYSGTSFFDRMEIKDQMAYFRLAVNPDDDAALRRVINKPVRGIGEAALARVMDMARLSGVSAWKILCSPVLEQAQLRPSQLQGLTAFRQLIQECGEIAASRKAYQAAYDIANLCGLHQSLTEEGDAESKSRADNIRELVDSVKAYEDDLEKENEAFDDGHRRQSTLADFIQNVMLLSNADTDDGRGDKVNLMTVHCAKGLEFPWVFVAGMEENLFPLSIDGTPKEEEEERRLFYVAVTRAERRLVLTRAEQRLRFGKRERTNQSRFIKELMGELEYE